MGATPKCHLNSIRITFASEDSIAVFVTVAAWLRQVTNGLAHDFSFAHTTKIISKSMPLIAIVIHFNQLSKLCSMANSTGHKEPSGTGDIFIAGMQYGS